jgi:hypothetical protein
MVAARRATVMTMHVADRDRYIRKSLAGAGSSFGKAISAG